MADLSNYQYSAADWRAQLKRNESRTRWVIATFIAIYLGVGLLCDVVLLNAQYGVSIGQALGVLISFKVWPYATLIMGLIAIVSLWITYALYDRVMLMGTQYHEVKPETAQSIEEKQLYNVVEEMKVAAGLSYMPRVYIIEADYMNAFASGYSEKSAMVAITRGLMQKLTRSEMQAVMAHELSHIRHHDIKLTLTIAVLSNIILIVLDILFYSVIFSRNDRNKDNRLAMIIIVLRYVLPLVTVLLTLFLSRTREYMADAGSVELMRDNEPMARALLKISQDHQQNSDVYRQQYGQTPHEDVRRASYIFDPVKAGVEPVQSFSSAFSTHPSLKNRLQALGFRKKQS